MNRVIFLIDGFNLYHSVVDASTDLSGKSTKWLNIDSLCQSYMGIIDKKATLNDIFYFSALAHHRQLIDPDTVPRHKKYLKCLRALGIVYQLSRFKPRETLCRNCHKTYTKHEEKETDVAIAAKLLEVLHLNKCDTIVLLTGDTDLAPAIKTAKTLFPKITIVCLFPYKRHNDELAKLSHTHIKIKAETYTKHQLADPFELPDGTKISKPPSW